MHRCAVVLHLCVSITNCIPKYRVTLLKRTNEKQIEKNGGGSGFASYSLQDAFLSEGT